MFYTRDSLTPEAIAKLKSEHGPALVAVFDPKGRGLVFRRPPRAVYDMWADKVGSREADSAAHRQLVFSCLAGCTEEEVVTVLDEYPALLRNEITSGITEMAGLGGEASEVKKL